MDLQLSVGILEGKPRVARVVSRPDAGSSDVDALLRKLGLRPGDYTETDEGARVLPQYADLKECFEVRTTPVDAEKDLAAALSILMAKVQDDELYTISDVEVFRTGKWNGEEYTRKDLDDMVNNFDRVGYQPPLIFGHTTEVGAPAAGWVKALRRVGDRLVADFGDLSESVYALLKARRYDHVSAEIWFNLKRGGETFRRALKAVALLGAETPAVSGLRPIRESFAEFEADGARLYTQEDYRTMSDREKELEAKVAELSAKIEKLNAKKSDDDEGALTLQLKKLQDQVELMSGQLEEAKGREATARVDRAVEKLTIPALREHFRSLFLLAFSDDAPVVVKFSTEVDGKPVSADTAPADVLDDLVERLNNLAEMLMKRPLKDARPTGDKDDEDGEDAGTKVHELAVALQNSEKITYSEALARVRRDPKNADLIARYASH